MLKIFFYALLYYCLTVQTAHPVVEIAFTPSKVCEEKIIELINNSQSSIDVAVYSINNQQIIDALYRARQRDVSIRILTDKLQASGKYSKVEEMHSNGLNIRVHTKIRLNITNLLSLTENPHQPVRSTGRMPLPAKTAKTACF